MLRSSHTTPSPALMCIRCLGRSTATPLASARAAIQRMPSGRRGGEARMTRRCDKPPSARPTSSWGCTAQARPQPPSCWPPAGARTARQRDAGRRAQRQGLLRALEDLGVQRPAPARRRQRLGRPLNLPYAPPGEAAEADWKVRATALIRPAPNSAKSLHPLLKDPRVSALLLVGGAYSKRPRSPPRVVILRAIRAGVGRIVCHAARLPGRKVSADLDALHAGLAAGTRDLPRAFVPPVTACWPTGARTCARDGEARTARRCRGWTSAPPARSTASDQGPATQRRPGRTGRRAAGRRRWRRR